MSGLDVLVVDAVVPFRDWLRAQSTSASTRVWADKFPASFDGSSVGIRLSRVGGGLDDPVWDRPLIQADIVANSGATAGTTAAELRTLLHSIAAPVALTTGPPRLTLRGAAVLSDLAAPDPTTGQPRRVLTIDLTTVASPT